MALVPFLGRSHDMLDIQHGVSSLRLPLASLLLLLLAPRLHRDLHHDNRLLLRPNLLHLLRSPLLALHIPLLNHIIWRPGSRHPVRPCSVQRPFQVLQGGPVRLHGMLRGNSGNSCCVPPLRSAHRAGLAWVRDINGASVWCWSCGLCY